MILATSGSRVPEGRVKTNKHALNQSKRPIILITEPCSEKGIAAFTTDRYTVFSVRTQARV
jgi:hypothetical protein